MPITFRLPEDLEGATIQQWIKRPGQPVAAGEAMAFATIDDAALPIQAPCAGLLARVIAGDGARCAANAPVAIISAP